MSSALEELKPRLPAVPEAAWEKLAQWAELMREWNERVNLVSRKDIDQLERHHLAPCLAITGELKLMNGARVIDVGTGGGLPGLPMAICYPQARFTLVDSVGKKIRVVEDITKRLNLKNVEVRNCRVETLKSPFDFVTGRAVADLTAFINWVRPLCRKGKAHSLPNGLLYWRGEMWRPRPPRSSRSSPAPSRWKSAWATRISKTNTSCTSAPRTCAANRVAPGGSEGLGPYAAKRRLPRKSVFLRFLNIGNDICFR